MNDTPGKESKYDEIDTRLVFAKTSGVKIWLYNWIFAQNIPGNISGRIEGFIAILIICNVIALFLEGITVLEQAGKNYFDFFEATSINIFIAELLLRFYLAPADPEFKQKSNPRLRFLSSPFTLIDILSIVPYFLSAILTIDLRILRLMRLIRVLKFLRPVLPEIKKFQERTKENTLREKIYFLTHPTSEGGRLHQYYDYLIIIMILVSVVSTILDSIEVVNYHVGRELLIIDLITVNVFTVELFLKLYCCTESPIYRRPIIGRVRYLKHPMTVVDFLAILPFYLEAFFAHILDLRFLRVFRLLRLLKLTKYSQSTQALVSVIAKEWPVMAGGFFVMLLLVVLAASLGYLLEHGSQPDKFENIPQAIYWAVITLASVGYGDIAPVTPAGRVLAIIMSLLGVGIFAIPAAVLASAFSEQLRQERVELELRVNDYVKSGKDDSITLEEIRKLASRLKLDDGTLEKLIDQATARLKSQDPSRLNLSLIEKYPEIAFLSFRDNVSSLKKISILMETSLSQPENLKLKENLNELEQKIWDVITKK